MSTIVNWLLILSLIVSQLSPFSLVFLKISNMQRNNVEVVEEQPIEVVQEPVVEETGLNVRLNNTLDLDGYCTIMIPSEYYEVLTEQSTFTKKVIRYIDNKSKITMSYVTNISRDADVPGYIVKELAEVDTVTNDKYDKDYNGQTWVVVPAKNQEDKKNIRVYYKLSSDKKTAFWMKIEVYEDSDDEDFDTILTKIIESYNMYYVGETVFETPTTGYYAENSTDGDGTIGNTTEYKANTTENNVYKTTVGFIEDADISYSWRDLEIIIDGNRIDLPCSIQDLYDLDFELNDTRIKDDSTEIQAGKTETVSMTNSNGASVTFTVLNSSNAELKSVYDCTVVKLAVDTSKILILTNDNKDGTTEEETETENGEETTEETETESSSESKTTSDINDRVILPGGITTEVYTEDLLSYYGTYSSTTPMNSEVQYVWRSDMKYMKIRAGVVQGIKYIELSSIEEE
jgi:hypothetical protein